MSTQADQLHEALTEPPEAAESPLERWRRENPEGSGPPRNPWQKWQDQDTRKSAIAAKCWECMGGSADYATGIREAIRSCSCGPENAGPRCPLWAWRPYK